LHDLKRFLIELLVMLDGPSGNAPFTNIVLDFLLQLRGQHGLVIEDLSTPFLP
jgi:hypothetical protein